MYTVYAIASIECKYVYVGLTSNIKNRLERHNKGDEKTTKPYSPYVLIYTEELEDRPSARKREKYFKSRTGKRFLYRLLKNNYKDLKQYSET